MHYVKQARTLLMTMTMFLVVLVLLPNLVHATDSYLSRADEIILRAELQEQLCKINDEMEKLMLGYLDYQQITESLEKVETLLKKYPRHFADIRERLLLIEDELDEYIQTLQTIKRKVSQINISTQMDMSQVLGLSSEEVSFILRSISDSQGNPLIKNELLISELGRSLPIACQIYSVNEIFVLAVMCCETGYFTSHLAQDYHNFGGILKNDGSAYHFFTIEEGILSAVRCLSANMQNGKDIHNINSTYCAPVDENPYYWSEIVLSIMTNIVVNI